MFQCRMCSGNPFGLLFGTEPTTQQWEAEQDRKKKKKDKARGSASSAKQSSGRHREETFNPRSPEEIKAVVKSWEQYAHPRAREFFGDPETLKEVLTQMAKGIDREDDPVLGVDEQCVSWYGDVTKGDFQAAIRMTKPGESNESVTYVNRVLAFIFATEESFEKLMQLPKEPFRMSCGDQLCVHLAHISLATSGPHDAH
eukprot:TRINITY_DN6401_c0_g1_i1.p1 TRINITY_DN6401_c0_g1~~TRINITY_DN6401_c0_g1_i1.p1  ORF type:complete len:199 (+),score=35.26 TRINITY_DN6401_c0_g1_i1:96-692(+)